MSRFRVRRWVPGSKAPMESISSSKNSHRTGCSIRGENTSRMPPRRANCPTPSTCWQRVYPALSQAFHQGFQVHPFPRLQSDRQGFQQRWRHAFGPAGRPPWPRSPARRRRPGRTAPPAGPVPSPGRPRRRGGTATPGPAAAPAPGLSGSPGRQHRVWTSRSSPQTNTAGRPVAFATAAPTQARCTGWRPVTAAGQPPASTRWTSSATWGSVLSFSRNRSITPSLIVKIWKSMPRRPRTDRLGPKSFYVVFEENLPGGRTFAGRNPVHREIGLSGRRLS